MTTHLTSSAKQLTLGSANNREQVLTIYGQIRQKGSDLTIMSGSITASGDISSSAVIRGLTGSFGSGTTHVHDSIQTANITGTGIIQAATLQTDSENFIATEKSLTLGSPLNRGQDLIVYGAIRVKGSDVTIMSGSISASGAITASGDISSSGNILAGSGGTGSFAHIITLDDTIEFRNSSATDEIIGYAKFDPVEGMIPYSASLVQGRTDVQSVVSMPKVANRIWKQNGDKIKIGGVEFTGAKSITPISHMGSTSQVYLDMNHFHDPAKTVYAVESGKTAGLQAKSGQSKVIIYSTAQIPAGTSLTGIIPFGNSDITMTINELSQIGAYNTTVGAIQFENDDNKISSTAEIPCNTKGFILTITEDTIKARNFYAASGESSLLIEVTIPKGVNFYGLTLLYA